jgi:hypothetical protein
VILAWISSRYECWDQSSFSLTDIETYMDKHQYGQANSWFLISSSFWLDTPNTHFNIYLHTSSLINSMQSDFPNLYPYKQTNIDTDLYPICPLSLNVCLVFLHLCILYSFINPWSRLIHYQTLLVHTKQAIIETNPKSSTHALFTICQICLLSHDTMMSHNIEAISSILFALLSCSWTRLFP